MKKRIKKNMRLALLSIGALGICLVLFNLLLQSFKITEQEVPVYQYNNKSNINYQVVLEPNNIFRDKVQGEDQIYLTKFIKHISTNFTYDFEGQEVAEIKGDYKAFGILEGLSSTGDDSKTAWSEKFTFIPSQTFSTTDSSITISEDIELNLKPYISLVNEVESATRARLNNKLTVYFEVDIEAETEYGIIQETVSSSIVIPVGENQFEITKNEIDEEKSLMVIKEIESAGISKTPQIILLCLLIGGVVYIKFFTINALPKTKVEKEIIKIFKEHASRLVALEKDISTTHKPNYKLKTMDDLVKVADEIEKPILYVYKYDKGEITRFFVVDETCIYSYEPKVQDVTTGADDPNTIEGSRSKRVNKPKFSFISVKKKEDN